MNKDLAALGVDSDALPEEGTASSPLEDPVPSVGRFFSSFCSSWHENLIKVHCKIFWFSEREVYGTVLADRQNSERDCDLQSQK